MDSANLPTLVILLLSFVCGAIGVHFGFRLAGINSKFADTFLIQAITLSCYRPLLTLIFYPENLRLVMAINDAKGKHLLLSEALKAISTPPSGDTHCQRSLKTGH